MAREHASQNRGLNQVVQSSREEGHFGYMFRRLPSFRPSDGLLKTLATGMRQGKNEVTDNPKIPAGYTYLGQFLDHDMTFDPTSELDRINDPAALENFRNPRFDLDSLYGSGPADEPFQYDKGEQDIKLLVDKVESLFGKVYAALASRLSISRIIATSMSVSLVCTFRS